MTLLELLIGLIPAFLIFAALLLGRYPGEGTIARLAESVARRTAKPRSPKAEAPRRRTILVGIRPGELLARSLATRPPPPLNVL